MMIDAMAMLLLPPPPLLLRLVAAQTEVAAADANCAVIRVR